MLQIKIISEIKNSFNGLIQLSENSIGIYKWIADTSIPIEIIQIEI